MSANGLVVGQKVIVLDRSRRNEPKSVEGEVLKIGRKLVYIRVGDAAWPEGGTPFYMDTGYERSDYAPRRFRTPEQAAEDQRRDDAIAALKEHGLGPVGFGGSSLSDISTDTLVAIVDVLAAGASRGRETQ